MKSQESKKCKFYYAGMCGLDNTSCLLLWRNLFCYAYRLKKKMIKLNNKMTKRR